MLINQSDDEFWFHQGYKDEYYQNLKIYVLMKNSNVFCLLNKVSISILSIYINMSQKVGRHYTN